MSGCVTQQVVAFNAANFFVAFPEFNGTNPATLQAYFNRACAFCDNTGAGPISDPAALTSILYLLTAHVAALAARNTAAQSNVVGRVTNGNEGSVSVALDAGPVTSGTQAWFYQTSYGMEAYTAMSGYRRGFYVPAPPVGGPVCLPPQPGAPGIPCFNGPLPGWGLGGY